MDIITIVGARPQFVKAATVSRAIQKYNTRHENSISEKIIHTGQHYDANMSDIFFNEMDIPRPLFTLGIGGGSHGSMTGRQLEKIEEILLEEKPDYVLVYGDTNSTLAGALAAKKIHIPVIHVESGLRSFNMQMPEEINRILTDQISNILFCPTESAVNNLMNEGFSDKNCHIYNVGDVMFDAAMYYSSKSVKPAPMNIKEDNFALATIHRAENTDNFDNLKNIVEALNEINKNMPVICPLHPRTRKILSKNKLASNFKIIDPIGYFEMIWLLQNCSIVLTDSGGLQKEAYFFHKPCVTLREQTEWIELVEIKANKLAGSDYTMIVTHTDDLLKARINFQEKLYGSANAAEIIIDEIIG